MPQINSNSITFVDITDSRKLEVYISSNLPTTQIKDSNTGSYSPDWSVTNLQLTSNIYLDSEKITPTTIQWYTRVGTTETLVGSSSTLKITTNVLSSNPIITYICRATYQNVDAFKEITFMRTDTGRNGVNGVDGTSVNILGSYNTLAELQAAHPTGSAGDAYIVDGDLYVWAIADTVWENVGNIQGPAGQDGKDAKSIVLSGDSQVFKVSKTSVIAPTTINVTAQTFNTTITSWTYSTNGGQTFLSTVPTGVSRNGNIVTITGSTITSNSIVIKASDGEVSDVFTIYKAVDGTDGTPGAQGAPAPIAFLTNENVTFSANAQGQIATTTITSNVVAYSGTTKVTPTIGTISGAPTGMTITSSAISASNEIMLTMTIANNATLGSVSSNMGVISVPITYPVSTVLYLTWSKVNSGAIGAGIKSTTVAYGVSSSASTKPADTEWQSTIPVVAEGQYLWTRTIIDYTDDSIADTVTYTYTKQGTKGDNGSAGSSVTVSSIQYQEGASATVAPTGTWSNSVVAVAEGKFLWTKTAFSDGKTAYGVARQGINGSNGVGIKSVTEYYLATSSSSGVTTSTTGWTTAVQTITVDKKYLWNYEIITYTDNTTSTTSPIIIGVFGNTGSTGATGKGIKSVTEYYLASTLSTGVTTSTTGWTTTIQSLTATNKYLWNYELITYTDNSTATINPVIIGVYGDKGDKGSQGDRGAGISSVTVTYGTSTSASTQPTSWQTTLPAVAEGSYLWTRTVTDYTDASIADTVTLTYAKQGSKGSTGSAGTSVTVSSIQYQAGTSATTAPTGTWSTSVVTVAEGSYLWTKTTFSDGKVAYGVAKQGAKGSAGVNAVTFQIYAPNGYLLSNELESLTLQTFAYDGSTAITSATYAWSYQENEAWVAISNATTSSLTLTKDDVIKSKTYRCAMTYKNTTYYSTATVQDQSDIYDVMICVSDNINPLTGIYYWVVYALLYSEQGEADALLGPISIDAPTNPVSGDYWYAVDASTQTVTLKKYNGSAWVSSTDKQAYAYDWRHIIDGTQQHAIGNTDKVQIISCNSFTSSATFQCIVTDTDGSKLARCNIHLTDTSDPIVSATAPVGVKDGQIWMQTQTDGTFLLYIWDADMSMWKQLNADTKNVVHTTKPSSYKTGDLWVVESDTVISGYTKGTLLQSSATTTTFAAAHWTPSLKYEEELSEVQNALKSYKQYMTVDSDGLHMQAKNADGTLSPFQALFTNTRLSFLQDDLEVAYISDNKLNIYEANIDVLSVEKKIQLQKFEWAIESNGSMSLIVNY